MNEIEEKWEIFICLFLAVFQIMEEKSTREKVKCFKILGVGIPQFCRMFLDYSAYGQSWRKWPFAVFLTPNEVVIGAVKVLDPLYILCRVCCTDSEDLRMTASSPSHVIRSRHSRDRCTVLRWHRCRGSLKAGSSISISISSWMWPLLHEWTVFFETLVTGKTIRKIDNNNIDNSTYLIGSLVQWSICYWLQQHRYCSSVGTKWNKAVVNDFFLLCFFVYVCVCVCFFFLIIFCLFCPIIKSQQIENCIRPIFIFIDK